jgi:hypothetical protein
MQHGEDIWTAYNEILLVYLFGGSFVSPYLLHALSQLSGAFGRKL